MRKLLPLICLLLGTVVGASAQLSQGGVIYQTGAFSGSCVEKFGVDRVTGFGYTCSGGVWTLAAGGSATPGGASGEIQFNNAGAFGGKSFSTLKSDLSLNNVDNTSDANKPVSTPQQTALNLKVPTSTTISTTSPLTGGGDLSTNRTFACPTCGVTGSGLNQFATTTSLQLSGVISDETGTSKAVFSDSPTFETKVLIPSGTKASPGLKMVGDAANGYGWYWRVAGLWAFGDGTNDILEIYGGAGIRLARTFGIESSSGAPDNAASDIRLERSTTNMWEINKGTLGDFADLKVRQHYVDATMTAGGTTGAQTINKAAGSVNFAAAATTLVVTNNLVTTTSIVICTVQTNDTTALIKNCVPAAGSFTINLNAAATAETKVGFLVVNK